MSAFTFPFPGGLTSLSSGRGVNAKHSEWVQRAKAYFQIDLMATGGHEIIDAAQDFLYRRHKEHDDVYFNRASMMTYQNILGEILGWYNAAMFREEWQPQFKQDGATAKFGDTDFYPLFAQDVDGCGTTFNSLLASIFECQLKFSSAWILTDKAALDPSQFANRAEQTAAGANDPYFVIYDPRSVINWGEDLKGNLTWAVVWAVRVEQTFLAKPAVIDRWTYYDQTTFKIFESKREDGQSQPNDADDAVKAIGSGPHALAELKRVPLRRLSIPKLFWLGNRALPQGLDHLNQDNSLRHALMMANLPMPAVFGEYDEKPTASETELNVFPTGSKFEWLEPKGISFIHSANRLAALREEMHRQCYLQAIGKDSGATASASSGYSKDMDWKSANDVLAKYAKWLRQGGEQCMRDLADARGDTQLAVSVSGTDFSGKDLDAALATHELVTEADIPSDTLEKVSQIDLAMQVAAKESDETLAKIRKEIEAAPTKSERLQMVQDQAQQQFGQALDTAINRKQSKIAVDGLGQDAA